MANAEPWYRRSLIINEKFGNQTGIANTYHQLGFLAEERGRPDSAERWYREALTIDKKLRNRPDMALSFAQLGILAEARGRVEEAMEWTVQCVSLFDEVPHSMTGTGPNQLARLTAELGIDTLDRCWHRVTGQPLPPAVRDFIASGPTEHAE
jgi:tetratricopeptide (TPR) repeat protein